ncbi:MAG: glycosyltransferase family 4 protein [Planctomycetales bacterium]|nr:glycosyltransferase family 4 protein [Planctomycetales bacterium]
MHILYFHQYFSTRSGSTGTRSYEAAQKLIQRGHDVTMVCASYGAANTGLSHPFKNGKREGKVDGIHVIEFELPISNRDSLIKRSWTFAKYSIRSSWVAITRHADVVFATSTPLTAAIPGLAARYFRRRKFVFEVRDLWPELPKAMGVVKNPLVLLGMAWLEKRAYRAAQHCIGLAPGIADGIARHIPRDRITMIPNGCDLDFLSADQSQAWLPESVPKNNFVAVFTGTHGPANGLDAVLDASKVLKERKRDDITLLLVGDGKLKDQLQSRARSEELDNVVFHDNVRKESIPGLLASCHVGLQILANVPAFYYGTSPNKFFDYLAAGKPVINNYPGWVAELITEYKCGIAVSPDAPDEFANALQYLADHRQLTQTMGEAARKLAEDKFDRSKLTDRFVEVLENTHNPKAIRSLR